MGSGYESKTSEVVCAGKTGGNISILVSSILGSEYKMADAMHVESRFGEWVTAVTVG
jgi:hypothetical protein